MASYRAPGVQVKEIDLSEVTVPAGTNVGALVGRTPKGMTNRRVLTTSNKDFVSKFGAPVNGDEYPIYTAIEFLKASDFLWFTRPATNDDKVGGLTITGTKIDTVQQEEAPKDGLFSEEGYEDGNQPNKYWPGEQLNVADVSIVALGASDENTNIGIIVVTEDNTETTGMEYTYGYNWQGKYPEKNANGKEVQYYRINVYTKNTSQTPEDAGWTSIDPLKTLVPTESWVVSNDPLAKDFSGNSLFVKDVVNGYSDFIYANTNTTGYPGKVYPNEGMKLLNSTIPVPAQLAAVEDANVKLDLSYDSVSVDGGELVLVPTGEIDGVEATLTIDEEGRLVATTADPQATYTFSAPSGWSFKNKNRTVRTTVVALVKTLVSAPEGSTITIESNWTLEDGSAVYTAQDQEEGDTVVVQDSQGENIIPTYVDSALNVVAKEVSVLGEGSYASVELTDGIAECWKALYGSKEQVTPNILMAPYVTENAVVKELVQAVCEIASTRRDCFAVVPASGLNVTNAQKIVDTELPKINSFARNSYCGIYAGADLVFDQYTNKNIYLPKVAFAGRIIANNDNVAHVWDAPAGLNRGAMGTLDQMKVYTEQEIGYMYANNVNTSKRVRGAGDYMWGQKTGQVKASALDRINVRRLLLYIENTLEPSLQAYLFEPNTELLRSRVKSGIDQFLQTIYAGGGLYAYNTVCDSTNNTPYTIDNNELNIDLYVQPVKTVEFINLNIIVTRTGVSFTEA